MKKFTVKHYLNTKIKGRHEEGLVYYPIYVQIIYNKFSTDKRSVSEILMTEKGFDFFSSTGELLEDEVIYNRFLVSVETLRQEIIDIESSIKIIKKWDLKVKRKNIFNVISDLSNPVINTLEDQYRLNLDIYIGMGAENEYNYDTKYEKFLKCFSGNIIDSIETIKDYTNIDLSSFLKHETGVDLEVLKLVRKMITSDKKKHYRVFHSFAEFAFMDYRSFFKEELKEQTVEYYDESIKSLEQLIDDYVEYVDQMHIL